MFYIQIGLKNKTQKFKIKNINTREDVMGEDSAQLKFEKFNIKTFLLECLIIMLGTFITAMGFKIFLTPHNIVPGGFMGVAQIIFDLIAKTGFTAIPVSVWYIILNAFLYVFAAAASLSLKINLASTLRTKNSPSSFSYH